MSDRPVFSSSPIRPRSAHLCLRQCGHGPQQGPASFHLVVPRQPHGMHKVVDPLEAGEEEARSVLAQALPRLGEAAGHEVTGAIGDAEPLMAIHDAVNLGHYDEIIISTLPLGVSRWLKLDLVSKARALGLPVTHVAAPAAREDACLLSRHAPDGRAPRHAASRLPRHEARHLPRSRHRRPAGGGGDR